MTDLNFSTKPLQSILDFLPRDAVVDGRAIQDKNIVEVEITLLKEFPEHYFRPYAEDKLDEMATSIKTNGQLQPIIVWKKDNELIILSGHNRVKASKRIGKEKVKAIVLEDIDLAQAKLIVTETNLYQRSFADMKISERAKGLKQRYDALVSKGLVKENEIVNNENIAALEQKENEFREAAGEDLGVSGVTVYRYIKLNDLSEELMQRVDDGFITMKAAYQLAFLKKDEQDILTNLFNNRLLKRIDESFAVKLKAKGDLTEDEIIKILGSKSKTKKSVKVKIGILKKYELQDLDESAVNNLIDAALEIYFAQNAGL